MNKTKITFGETNNIIKFTKSDEYHNLIIDHIINGDNKYIEVPINTKLTGGIKVYTSSQEVFNLLSEIEVKNKRNRTLSILQKFEDIFKVLKVKCNINNITLNDVINSFNYSYVSFKDNKVIEHEPIIPNLNISNIKLEENEKFLCFVISPKLINGVLKYSILFDGEDFPILAESKTFMNLPNVSVQDLENFYSLDQKIELDTFILNNELFNKGLCRQIELCRYFYYKDFDKVRLELQELCNNLINDVKNIPLNIDKYFDDPEIIKHGITMDEISELMGDDY